MTRTYTTAVGATVELSNGIFRSTLYCHGCQKGWNIKPANAKTRANQHAATCRRRPGTARPTPSGGVARTRR